MFEPGYYAKYPTFQGKVPGADILGYNDVIKMKIKDLFDRLFYNANDLIMKYLCKFEVNLPINARGTAVQSLESLHTC